LQPFVVMADVVNVRRNWLTDRVVLQRHAQVDNAEMIEHALANSPSDWALSFSAPLKTPRDLRRFRRCAQERAIPLLHKGRMPATSAGKVSKVPPPAIELTAPAASAAKQSQTSSQCKSTLTNPMSTKPFRDASLHDGCGTPAPTAWPQHGS